MDLFQISNKFPSELDAIKYFEKQRWGDKIRCPYCNSDKKGIRNKDNRFHCKNCNKTYSVVTGTWLHYSKIPLRKWMMAITLITNAKKGISAKQLQRDLNVSYPTAGSMSMTLRKRMCDDEPVKLNNIVEIDETYVGGAPRTWKHPDKLDYNEKEKYERQLEELKQKGLEVKNPEAYKKKYAENVKRGRGTNKTAVVGMIEREGRIIAEVMKTLTYANLEALVRRHVENLDKTVIISDKYKGYNKFDTIINHIIVDHTKMMVYKGIHTNTIESFWAIVKRGIMGQYHNVSVKYLPMYITELVYKYNHRNKSENSMFNKITKKSMEKRKII